MEVFDELKERGLIAQMTHEDKIKELFQNEKVTFYIGFDATADSLHIGHFLQLVVMSHLQKAGHKPIVILGGGTSMVGDPTGKTDMRKMLTREQIAYNTECFKKQMSKFIDFSQGKALMLDNADWLCKLNYIDFLRDIGVHFSVNRMLTADCFKSRLEKGLSFIEFNYMLMQSYDFLYLSKNYNCKMELGGDDQWSNIINGVDLIRRVTGEDSYGMTFTLLTTKEGKKMGKTEKGAVWLDETKTTPYEFFQYWRNIDDSDVINCMKMITFMSLDEIATFEKLEGKDLNTAKEKLAFELTKIVHGEDEAKKALEAAKALFSTGVDNTNMPTTKVSLSDIIDNEINILELLLLTGLAASKGEGRRLIEQGGISVNDVKVTSFTHNINVIDFNDGFIIRKGKKIFNKIVYK